MRVLMMKRGVIVADEAIGTILHLPWCVITDVDLETIDLETHSSQNAKTKFNNRTRIFHLLDISSFIKISSTINAKLNKVHVPLC